MISIFYLKIEKQKSSLFVFLIFTFFITLKNLSLKKLLLYQSTCQIKLTLFFLLFPFDQKNLCSSDVFREIKGNIRNNRVNHHCVKGVQIQENADLKKLRIWTLFTQCMS